MISFSVTPIFLPLEKLKPSHTWKLLSWTRFPLSSEEFFHSHLNQSWQLRFSRLDRLVTICLVPVPKRKKKKKQSSTILCWEIKGGFRHICSSCDVSINPVIIRQSSNLKVSFNWILPLHGQEKGRTLMVIKCGKQNFHLQRLS